MIKVDEFVKAWKSSQSLKEVVAKTKLSPASASARASVLRNKPYNIPLRKFHGGRTKVLTPEKVAELRKLALSK